MLSCKRPEGRERNVRRKRRQERRKEKARTAIFYSSSNLETFDLCEQIFVLAQIHIEALRFDEGLATLQEVER